jgi:hypothetical protein
MAQQALPGSQIHPAFPRRRGNRMAQGVNTARLGDPCPLLGRIVELLGGGGIPRHGLAALREQPGAGRALHLPVGAQFRQQAGS